ncbi:hypothetical protein [Lutimonas vermicola]|uniref:Uncharacterized protein n=1 Tax=Lutimonas vermicola TaxID=414288 RepID=A0ABU9L4F6_9FLAO
MSNSFIFENKSSQTKKKLGRIFVSLLPILIALPLLFFNFFNLGVGKVNFTLDINGFTQILGSVLILSLIVERFVEGFVPDKDKSEKKLLREKNQYAINAVENNKMGILRGLIKENQPKGRKTSTDENEISKILPWILDNSKKVEDFRGKRMSKVKPIALTLGVLISISGIRFMSELFTPVNFCTWQDNYFIFVDIVLSGTVIGGGSDFVHQLMNRFDPKS